MQVVLKEEGVRHILRVHKEMQRMIALHGGINLSVDKVLLIFYLNIPSFP